MSITVVTTFHKPGLDLYGQRFIDSFQENVDPRVKLFVYAEDCDPVIENTDQITVLDATQTLPKLNAFKSKWKDVPKANGKCPPEIKAKRPRDWHKEFKWDAVRFSNKVYAVFDACYKAPSRWVVWIDADTYFHSKLSYDEFVDLLPNNNWLTYVGRGKGASTWPECGFYGMNLDDPACKSFLEDFETMYENAERGIFALEEWHDSYVFGHILNRYKKDFPHVLDYTADMMLKTALTGGGGHPLINTVLGKYMDHLKGGRKKLGKSQKKDLVIKRKEKWWKQ